VSRWLQLVESQERSVYIGRGGRGVWASGNISGGEGEFRRGRVNSETRSDRVRVNIICVDCLEEGRRKFRQ
jgi:hypothetical protein